MMCLMERTHFENLRVYQLAELVEDRIWNIVTEWSDLDRETVGRQLVRCCG